MSARTRADRALTAIVGLLRLPGAVVEETLHALASWPWADRIAVEFEPGEGTARTRVEWGETTPRWAVVLAHLAPEVAASVTAVAVIAYWVVVGPLWWPASTLDWVLLWLLGTQYLAIAIPSRSDAGLGGGA